MTTAICRCTITPLVFDREEQSEVIPPDEIVISPTPSNPRNPDDLVYEVNVIEWGNSPVLDAAASLKLNVDLGNAQYGWAKIALNLAILILRFVRTLLELGSGLNQYVPLLQAKRQSLVSQLGSVTSVLILTRTTVVS